MQQQVECHDEETLELKETYSSLQQEVDIKTKKLKKVAATPVGDLCDVALLLTCFWFDWPHPIMPLPVFQFSIQTNTRQCFLHAFPVLAAVINDNILSK